MINVIKSGVGNVGSLIRVIEDLEIQYKIVEKPQDFSSSPKILLPGVGSFDSYIGELKKNNLFDEINERVVSKKHSILGICVGMQSLFNGSNEGVLEGFKFIEGVFNKFIPVNNQKVPHLGWNTIDIRKDDPLFSDINNKSFYFAHGYSLPFQEENCLTSTDYIIKFCSSVKKDNIYGVQFHPEKSYSQGLQLIKNFILKC